MEPKWYCECNSKWLDDLEQRKYHKKTKEKIAVGGRCLMCGYYKWSLTEEQKKVWDKLVQKRKDKNVN